jgi:hypothetical protein
MAYALAGKFSCVLPQLKDLINKAFRGWAQSRINELGNKVLRDGEVRANASKVFSAYSELF